MLPEVLAKLLPEGDLWAALDSLWSDDLVKSEKDGAWIVPYEIFDRFDNEEDREIFELLRVPVSQNTCHVETNTNSHVGDPAFSREAGSSSSGIWSAS